MQEDAMWLKPSRPSFSRKTRLKLALWLVIQKTLFRISPSKRFRIWLLNIFGANVQRTCFVSPTATIYMPWNLVMGDRSSIDFETLVYNLDRVTIGDFVSISYRVNINTGSHDCGDPYFRLITDPIFIGSGVFVGAEAYLGPGVKIGLMAVIGARSVVIKDMPSAFICVGHPCKPIKIREKTS